MLSVMLAGRCNRLAGQASGEVGFSIATPDNQEIEREAQPTARASNTETSRSISLFQINNTSRPKATPYMEVMRILTDIPSDIRANDTPSSLKSCFGYRDIRHWTSEVGHWTSGTGRSMFDIKCSIPPNVGYVTPLRSNILLPKSGVQCPIFKVCSSIC